MLRHLLIPTLAAVLTLGLGCGTDDPSNTDPSNTDPSNTDRPNTDPPNTDPPSGDVLRSSKARITSPGVGQPELAALVGGNTEFALALYQQLAAVESGNLFYSPYSISAALAMTYAGARGNTDKQMLDTLRFAGQTDTHPGFNALDLALESRGQGAAGKDGKGFRLKVANALWGQKDYPILAPFLDTLAEHYGAGLHVVNFETETEKARQTINAEIARQTEDRIEELLKEGDVDELTRMVLTNAIYFNAAWDEVFPEEYSGEGDFLRLDGSRIKVPVMRNTHSFPYAEGDGWKTVELPYDGKELSMVVLVPEAGRFAEIEGKLDAQLLDTVIDGLAPSTVPLTLPKFEFRSRFGLRKQLAAMGMPEAFDAHRADFTGMNGGIEPLYIGNVIHEAFVSIDEKGTEAAAATAVIMEGGSMPPPPFIIDRPFIFLIRDLPTGSILFVGRVTDPTK